MCQCASEANMHVRHSSIQPEQHRYPEVSLKTEQISKDSKQLTAVTDSVFIHQLLISVWFVLKIKHFKQRDVKTRWARRQICCVTLLQSHNTNPPLSCIQAQCWNNQVYLKHVSLSRTGKVKWCSCRLFYLWRNLSGDFSKN